VSLARAGQARVPAGCLLGRMRSCRLRAGPLGRGRAQLEHLDVEGRIQGVGHVGCSHPASAWRYARHEWSSEDVVREALESHVIPVDEPANGGVEGVSDLERA